MILTSPVPATPGTTEKLGNRGALAQRYDDGPDLIERRRRERLPLLFGRALFGGFFLYNGINHFMHHETLTGYAQSKGVPAAGAAVAASGAMLVAGGLSLLTGHRPKVGAALVAGFLLGVSPTVHAFWREPDPQARANESTQFLKNVGLLGGALLAASHPEPWPMTI